MTEELRPLLVRTGTGVREAAAQCRAAGRFAFDTEADSFHSYFHKVCLLQVSAAEQSFIIDPLTISSGDLEPLWEVTSDPAIVVVMHGADYDMRVIDRDYGARVRGLEDTEIMARLLGEERTGLATLVKAELGVELDKSHQRADWSRRPLSQALLEYAAADTAHLHRLGSRLRSRLQELGRWSWAEEEFRRLETVRHVPVEPDPRAFERVKGGRRLRGEARDRLFTLYEWREARAQHLDVPPFKVLGNRQLLSLASSPVDDLAGLARVEGLGPRFVRRWGKVVLGCMRRPRNAPRHGARKEREPQPDAATRRRQKRLAAARDTVATSLGLDAGLVCPRAVLEAVAAASPGSREQLAGCGLGGWRLELLEEPLLAVVEDEA